MSPPSAPTERLKSLSQHLVYSKTTTPTTTTTATNSSSPDHTPEQQSYTFIGTPISRKPSPDYKPTFPNHTPTPTTTTMSTTTMMPTRPAITCHVLDTTLGRPAPSIPVTLISLPSTSPPPPSPPAPNSFTTPFSNPAPTVIATGITNSDGRVAAWTFAPLPGQDEDGERWSISTERGRVYMLRFETEGYYRRWYGDAGGFFPWVDVVFKMGGGEMIGEAVDGRDEGERKHYHVPLLLSRFGYSTYRGS